MVKVFRPRVRRHRHVESEEWKKFFTGVGAKEEQEEAARREAARLKHVRGMSLADTSLSVRTINALEKNNILMVGQLADKTRDELMSISNFGESTLRECRDVLNGIKIPHPNWRRRPRKKLKKKPAPVAVKPRQVPKVKKKKAVKSKIAKPSKKPVRKKSGRSLKKTAKRKRPPSKKGKGKRKRSRRPEKGQRPRSADRR